MSLRPWQLEAVRAVSRTWQDHDRALVVAATGAGKTRMAGEIIVRRKAAGRGRALALAPRIGLVDQAIGAFTALGLTCEAEQGDRLASLYPSMFGGSDVVVACVSSLRGRRLERWDPSAFATVWLDECHHAAAASQRAVLDRFSAAKILGVTATPDRGDDVALGHVFPNLAYEYSISAGIRDGVLCPIIAKAIDCPSVDLSSVRVTSQAHGRDLSAADLEAALTKDDESMLAVCKPIADLAGERPTLVFGPSVKWAHEYRRIMGRIVGPDLCGSLDGGATQAERADVLGAYAAGRIRFLFNCQLLTEGFDAPSTACIVVARPTKSRALFAQIVGRGTRIAPGKRDLLVLTLHPSGEQHDLARVVDLFAGKDLDAADRDAADRAIMSGEDALRVMSRASEAAEARRRSRERDTGERLDATVRARVRTIDLFGAIGLDESPGDARGPRATERQREALARVTGREIGDREFSIKQAATMLDAVNTRRKAGLCTLKQARQLAKHGLRTDLSFAEAGAVMTVLAENGWRMTATVAERFGT